MSARTILNAIEQLTSEELTQVRDRIDFLVDGGRRQTASDARTGLDVRGPSAGVCPARLFSVAQGVRYLDGNGLEMLTRAFREWLDDAANDRSRRSRLRMWLVFLVLRYTGARLAEVLALNERSDFDFLQETVRLGAPGDNARTVPLPKVVMAEVRRGLTNPLVHDIQGGLFMLDQGYVRRQFSAQEERSGLPRELLNPRTLRHSRAIELLRGGVPLPAVQAVLGHSTLELTSAYCTFSQDDTSRIIQNYINKERSMNTSARNTFQGEVTQIRSAGILAEVVLRTSGGHEVVSLITDASAKKLGITEGRKLTALIKAPWVLIEKEEQVEYSSARNRFAGKIDTLRGDDFMTEVIGILEDGTSVCALVTTESATKLGLKKGETVWFLVKATSVILSA